MVLLIVLTGVPAEALRCSCLVPSFYPCQSDEESKGAHGVSQAWREARAAGEYVSRAGVNRPNPWRVRSPLLVGNCTFCQHCRHSYYSSGQSRDTPSDGLALGVPLQEEKESVSRGRRHLVQAACKAQNVST